MNKRLRVSVFIIVLLLAGNAFLVFSHELAHQLIYAKFGVESEVGLHPLGIVTQTTSSIPEDNREVIGALQVMNEIFGYQTIAMFNCLALLAIFLKVGVGFK